MKKGCTVEYKMSKTLAAEILKHRKGTDAKKNPQESLVRYVNEQCGLLHPCVRVIVD